jgi:hypothetical protein
VQYRLFAPLVQKQTCTAGAISAFCTAGAETDVHRWCNIGFLHRWCRNRLAPLVQYRLFAPLVQKQTCTADVEKDQSMIPVARVLCQ